MQLLVDHLLEAGVLRAQAVDVLVQSHASIPSRIPSRVRWQFSGGTGATPAETGAGIYRAAKWTNRSSLWRRARRLRREPRQPRDLIWEKCREDGRQQGLDVRAVRVT